MNKKPPKENGKDWEELSQKVDTMERRKLRARKEKYLSLWFGMGMFGVIGWSVAIPTLIGVTLGVWIDNKYPGRISWTLTLLFIGTFIGCLNAWYWIKQQSGREPWKK